MVKEYLKKHKIGNMNGVKKWAVVHIRFLSGANEDETSFDIENIVSEQGIDDLNECFSEFCKEQESHEPISMITSIDVYASANTKEKLDALTVKEN